MVYKTVLAVWGVMGLSAFALPPAKMHCVMFGSEVELQTMAGDRLGDPLTSSECGQARKNAGPAFACAKFGTQWFLTRVETGQKFGPSLPLSDCTQIAASSGPELYCSQKAGGGSRPWYPTHWRTQVAFGRFGTSLADCLVLTKYSVPGLVCTNTGTYNFAGRKPTRVDERSYSDSNLMGASGQQEPCTRATAESRGGYVCVCNGDFCGNTDWIKHDVARNQSMGPNTTIASCIASQ
ncbi:hypothetical protein K2X33_14890 [bacterium]|nr:hypothetical protein [bacterium]